MPLTSTAAIVPPEYNVDPKEQVKHTHAKAGGGTETHTHAGAIDGHKHGAGDALNASGVALLPLPKGALSGKAAPYRPDADETVKCPSCGKMNDTDAAYCDQCGAKLPGEHQPYRPDADETVKCPACGKMNDTDARFCDQCGAALPAGKAAGDASNLIDWFNSGADGAIDWGDPGDWQQCVDIASDHMDEDQAAGFCELRHQDATGMSTSEHRAEEGGGKSIDIYGWEWEAKVAGEKRAVSPDERQQLAQQGHTFRGTSYPIDNLQMLNDALQSFGRSPEARNNVTAFKRYLLKEAKRLKASQDVIDRINALGQEGKSAPELGEALALLESGQVKGAEDMLDSLRWRIDIDEGTKSLAAQAALSCEAFLQSGNAEHVRLAMLKLTGKSARPFYGNQHSKHASQLTTNKVALAQHLVDSHGLTNVAQRPGVSRLTLVAAHTEAHGA